jgi:signal transduction histidine kinase
MKKITAFLLCLFGLFTTTLATQEQNLEIQRKVDSLEHILNTHKLTPIEQVCILDSIDSLFPDDLEKRILYLGRKLEIIEKGKINDKNLSYSVLSTLGMCNMLKGNHDLALHYLNKALQLARELNNAGDEVRMITNLGNTHALQGKYALALDYYLQALSLCEKLKIQNFNYSRILGNIAEIYYMMGNRSQALFYAERFFEINPRIVLTTSGDYLYAQVYYIIASVYLDRGELDKAEENALKSFQCVENHNLIYQCFSMEALARIYLQRGNYDKALEYANESLRYAGGLDDPALYVKAYNVLSTIYLEQKQYDKSEAAVLKAMELNPVALDTEPNLAYTMASANIHLGNKEKADYFLAKYNEIMKRNNEKNFHETLTSMEIQYETGKKELHIAALEKEKMFYIWSGITGIALLLLIVGLLLHRHRINLQKQRFAEQQIKQLEQEKQLVATQAVLDGETAERTRLARDLHDGLGSMLSVIKINLQDMNAYSIMDNHDVGRFTQALNMLDKSISELRHVAHHIMPESLVRFGLKVSLEDFCHAIPIADFRYFGEDFRLDSRLEIMLYRCAHELVNNAVKYAEANTINVQLMVDDNLVSLNVQDDGVGFDPEAVTGGSGLENIRTRVSAYNGTMTVYASPGKGTEVNIEIVTNHKKEQI